jgi:hypothetical protein
LATRRPGNSAYSLRKLLVVPAAALAGFCLFAYFGPRGAATHQINPAALAQTTLSSAQPAAVNVPQNPVVASAPPIPSKDDKASPPPTNAPLTKPVSAARDPTLENWFVASYLRCWSPPANLPSGEKYGAQIRVVHKVDGSLAAAPRLVNPPTDPEWRPYADSAVRAVTKCNPLRVPPQYVAQFDQWKKMTLHF